MNVTIDLVGLPLDIILDLPLIIMPVSRNCDAGESVEPSISVGREAAACSDINAARQKHSGRAISWFVGGDSELSRSSPTSFMRAALGSEVELVSFGFTISHDELLAHGDAFRMQYGMQPPVGLTGKVQHR